MCAISSLTSTFAISSPDEFLSSGMQALNATGRQVTSVELKKVMSTALTYTLACSILSCTFSIISTVNTYRFTHLCQISFLLFGERGSLK